MKTDHRHDLKKNDLADKLSDLQGLVGPRSKSLGVIVVGVDCAVVGVSQTRVMDVARQPAVNHDRCTGWPSRWV